MVFIDKEKVYDQVPRDILQKDLEKKGVSVTYIKSTQNMYDRVLTNVRTSGNESKDFL